jgi:hypothetical protein
MESYNGTYIRAILKDVSTFRHFCRYMLIFNSYYVFARIKCLINTFVAIVCNVIFVTFVIFGRAKKQNSKSVVINLNLTVILNAKTANIEITVRHSIAKHSGKDFIIR